MNDPRDPDEPRGPLSDPQTLERLRRNIAPLSDPETLERLRRNIAPLSDPETLERLRRNIAPLSDPEVLRQLREQLREVGEEAAVEPFAQRVEAFDTELNKVETDAAAGATATGADEFAWIDALPTLQQIRLLNVTLEVLVAVLALIATLSSLGVPLALAAAAEVLIRLAHALVTRLDAAGAR